MSPKEKKTAIKIKFKAEYPKAILQKAPGAAYKAPKKGHPVIISLDKIAGSKKEPRIGTNEVRCDELVAFDKNNADTGIHIIERKTMRLVKTKIKSQLDAGMKFIERFIDRHGELNGENLDYRPIVISKRSPPRDIMKIKITSEMRGDSKRIQHVFHGAVLPSF